MRRRWRRGGPPSEPGQLVFRTPAVGGTACQLPLRFSYKCTLSTVSEGVHCVAVQGAAGAGGGGLGRGSGCRGRGEVVRPPVHNDVTRNTLLKASAVLVAALGLPGSQSGVKPHAQPPACKYPKASAAHRRRAPSTRRTQRTRPTLGSC